MIRKKIIAGAIGLASLTVAAGMVWAAFGGQLANFVPSTSGNGRAVAFDGTNLYYSLYSDPGVIYKTDPSNSAAVPLATNPALQWGALAWDSNNQQLWGARYGDTVADFYTIDASAGNGVYQFTFDFPDDESCYAGVNNPDGLGYDATDDTLWISDDAATRVYHVDTTGAVLSDFETPNGKCNTGIAVNGEYLWLGVQSGPDQGPHEIYRVAKDDPTTVLSTIPFGDDPGPEDLELDLVTWAPWRCALWSNQFGDENHLIAWELEEGIKDACSPVSCVETVNPHGKTIPPAGSTTLPGLKGGQNEDGFYELILDERVDPDSQIFVVDSGSGTVFGPFKGGTKVKYTEANGATPNSKKIGSDKGQAGAVSWHITGTGDMQVFAVDPAGNRSVPASCLVPPPPK